MAVPAGRGDRQAPLTHVDQRVRHAQRLAAVRGDAGGAAVALVADVDRRHLHRSGPGRVERRQQRELHRVGRRVPARERNNQQGLVRFAKRAISPIVDPIQNYTELAPTITPLGPGTVRVGWPAAWDRDNARLTVEVLRGATTATSTVLKTFQTDTTWWNRPPLGFVDTTAPPGSTQTYRIRVTDPFGNGFAGRRRRRPSRPVRPTASTYRATVLADSPDYQWRMGEASGTTAYDQSGSNDLTLNSANNRNIAGRVAERGRPRYELPGHDAARARCRGLPPTGSRARRRSRSKPGCAPRRPTAARSSASVTADTGRSSSDGTDRHLYMNNSGQIYFGVRPDMGTRVTINSPSTYRDNQWHHVVATLGSDGMKLFVDGNQVAANANVKKAQVYRGYWRVGGDRLPSWPSTPNREAITANLDELAVYPTALSLGHIRAHYLASGRSAVFPNIPPTPSFTSTTHYLTASFDGTGSSDDDGTIASYAWNFGDGTTGTGATPQHTYATAGTYTVTLTVTDNRGGTARPQVPSPSIDPPPNITPVASFTSRRHLSARRRSRRPSTDEDGTIVSYAWDFGDGSSGTGATRNTRTRSPVPTPSRSPSPTTAAAAPRAPAPHHHRSVRGRHVRANRRERARAPPTTAARGPCPARRRASRSRTESAGSPVLSVGIGPRTSPRSSRPTWTSRADALARHCVHWWRRVRIADRPAGVQRQRLSPQAAVHGGRHGHAYLVRTVGGAETILATATVPGGSVNPGDELRTRFLVTGTPTTPSARRCGARARRNRCRGC